MFIRTNQFLKLVEDKAQAEGVASVLRTENAKQVVTIDWLRTRVNQLEKERAILMRERTGLTIPIPEIDMITGNKMRETRSTPPLPSFEDVGDEEAARLGVDHNEMGELVYIK